MFKIGTFEKAPGFVFILVLMLEMLFVPAIPSNENILSLSYSSSLEMLGKDIFGS